MDSLLLTKGLFPRDFLNKTAEHILSVQQEDGSIPWFTGGKLDPWDHTEATMGLSIIGHYSEAESAYGWLRKEQLEDGSWFANYQDGKPLYSDKRETNFVAYVATGVWHHYLITENIGFLELNWPMVESAIQFVLRQQSFTGEIYWAVMEDGEPHKDALITGCSSVLKSLECAILIAQALNRKVEPWLNAWQQLGQALKFHPEYFDRTWESKERFSMDWFYPILAGVFRGQEARDRIQTFWDKFVRKDMGCLCVSDQPWVTIAESCELTMALLAAGEKQKATQLYSWLHNWRDSDGGYWTGYQYVEEVIWPQEKTTWTAGAILLAADALTEHTAASRLFLESSLEIKPEVELPETEEALAAVNN
ncbi:MULTISPECIES: prenyltransferase/squalene oxidase repeat-containing protein [unclassified Endozoicomonas]|uniref:prenyltransferase/squalene oxidase repeat-containing protein n=1 Tax=unclassified Endozoicomonas TaxID=2644528 RepID=UPI003BAF5B0F